MTDTNQPMTGEVSENDAGAVNASMAETLPICSQPSTKTNSQYRMNRLSLKKKSSFRPPRSSDAPLASPSPGSSGATPPMVPEGAPNVQGKLPSLSLCATAVIGARESACSKDNNGCNWTEPSASGGTATVQAVSSRRPTLLTGIGARFKPPGMLAAASGHGSNPLPPPGWKPRKKDLASFDMLDDLPDLAAVAPQSAPGAAAAVSEPVEPGADHAATSPLSEQQPGPDKNWQRKPFVPPRPQGAAGEGASADVRRAPNESQAETACDQQQAVMPETRAQPLLGKAGGTTHPLNNHRSVAEPASNGRETATGMDMDGADMTAPKQPTMKASNRGTSRSNVDERPEQQEAQQQQPPWRQGSCGRETDNRPGACIGSAGRTPSAERAEQASGRNCTGPAGSSRLQTPSSAAAVLGPSGQRLKEPTQTAGRSTERRRQLKRLYTDNSHDDSLPGASPSRPAGASQDEDDEGLLEDLSFLRAEPPVRTTVLGTSRHRDAAGEATIIPEPRLPFASRLGRASGTEQPAASRIHKMGPDFVDSLGLHLAPDGDSQLHDAEQTSEADASPSQQQPDSNEHGSEQRPAADDDGDWHETGATEADEQGPRRRAFKRLRKLSDRPQAGCGSEAAAAASSRPLADWTDDEDNEEDERCAAPPPHAVEQAHRVGNPFARAAKRQAQEPTLANHALPARAAKAAANHLSTTDIASVLMAPRSSHTHRERPGSAHKAGSAAAACEEVIDLAADSSDDDDAPMEARASEQPMQQQQTKRKGIVRLPPAPEFLLGRPQSLHRLGQQSAAFTPAGQGGPRKQRDGSYLGTYSAADLAEGKFPGWTSVEDRSAAAVSRAADADHGKGKHAAADDDEYGYGGGYHADVAGTSGGWGSGEYEEDSHQEEWEDWGDPGGGAGPSYASPERRQPQSWDHDWEQPGVEEELGGPDAEAANAGGAHTVGPAQEAGTSGTWKGPPWWTRLDDFVPVAAMRGGRDPRDGSVVHIDYAAQFSGAAAPRGSGAAASGRKRSRGSGGRDATGDSARGRERVHASSAGGHWVTEYERRGPVKVYITAAGRRLKGEAAYKASKKDNPGAAVPLEPKAKQKRRNGGWRSKKSR